MSWFHGPQQSHISLIPLAVIFGHSRTYFPFFRYFIFFHSYLCRITAHHTRRMVWRLLLANHILTINRRVSFLFLLALSPDITQCPTNTHSHTHIYIYLYMYIYQWFANCTHNLPNFILLLRCFSVLVNKGPYFGQKPARKVILQFYSPHTHTHKCICLFIHRVWQTHTCHMLLLLLVFVSYIYWV